MMSQHHHVLRTKCPRTIHIPEWSQYINCRLQHGKERSIDDCKVIPEESVVLQHQRVVVERVSRLANEELGETSGC